MNDLINGWYEAENTVVLKGSEERMTEIRKFRPNAEVRYDDGNDGRDGHYYIAFSCPNCGREINQGYKSETACDRCGTFYAWGPSRPIIEIIREVRWD